MRNLKVTLKLIQQISALIPHFYHHPCGVEPFFMAFQVYNF